MPNDLSTENLRSRLDSYFASHSISSPSLPEIKKVGRQAGFTLDDNQAEAILQMDPFRDRYEELVQALPDDLYPTRDWLLDPSNVAYLVGRTPRLNAVTIPSATGYLVILNEGQITFMYKVIRAICTRIAIPNEQNQELDEAAGIIAQALDWLRSAYNVPVSQDFGIGPEQLRIASIFSALSETFILCHELSHIFRGHLKGQPEEDFLEFDDLQLKALQPRFEEEVAADLTGVQILLDVAPRLGYTLEAAVAGYELYLFSVMLLEYAMSDYADSPSPLSATHPPARYRIGMLHKSVTEELGHPELLEEGSMAYQNSQIIYSVAGRLKKIQAERDKAVSNTLASLLRETAAGRYPLYLFDSVASQALMDAPRVALPILLEAANSTGSNSQQDGDVRFLARRFLDSVAPSTSPPDSTTHP
jgi:hypothetical protein